MLEKGIKAFRLQMVDCKTEEVVGHCYRWARGRSTVSSPAVDPDGGDRRRVGPAGTSLFAFIFARCAVSRQKISLRPLLTWMK
jgi:hypothetical protein